VADGAAVDAMRLILNTIQMNGKIVIGEGEKDEAPMLYNGEILGDGSGPELDIAVDPNDGTRPIALGLSNAIATVALAPRGPRFDPGPFYYMMKIAVGPGRQRRDRYGRPNFVESGSSGQSQGG
jgi:fructose-1,6-bisphosphatase II